MASLVALRAPVWGTPLDVDSPPEGRFNDDWAEIYISGAKSGFAHSTMTRDGGRIHTTTDMKLRVGRAGQTVELGIVQETTEMLSGLPLKFSSTMDMSTAKMVTRGTVEKGRVTIVTSQFGMEQTQTFGFPEGALMTWGAFRESIKRGFKPGTEYTVSMYAPELRMDGALSAKTTIGDWEEFTHRGKPLRGQKVTLVMQSPIGSVEMLSWVDENGEPLKAKVPMPGIGDMDVVTTDQATALAAFLPPEVFMTTVVKVDREIDRDRASRIRYRITCRTPEGRVPDLPPTAMQEAYRRPDGSVELTVTKRSPSPSADGAAKLLLEEGEYLCSNLMMNTDDAVLRELASQAAGEEKDAYALADRLRRFVTEYVTAKTMNIGFATANEVARTKEGDCSEHAVLLAALGRIRGLPSRVVAGLAYAPFFGGQDHIFGYHMWTQFWIDGRWVDLDAALRESACSPARIALATSSLKDAGLADLSLPLLTTIGALNLQILEMDTGPSPSR